jgi:hypothetical protein
VGCLSLGSVIKNFHKNNNLLFFQKRKEISMKRVDNVVAFALMGRTTKNTFKIDIFNFGFIKLLLASRWLK